MSHVLQGRVVIGWLMLAWVGLCAAVEVPAVSLEEASRRLSAGGFVMMMRHEVTVAGLGDPPGYRLDDCSTQRLLSDAGRARARAAGEAMRAAGIIIQVVRAGRWCRTQDTAQLAFGGFESWSALDSFFDQRDREPAQLRSLVDFAASVRAPHNAMLVTHQVNITSALGVWPAMGEVVAGQWRDGRLSARFRFTPAGEAR